MNTQFHTPSFGDKVFDDLSDVGGNTSSTTPASSLNTNNNFIYWQKTHQTKRMISLHNTSDEYHTANEESFTTNTSLMNTTNNEQSQQPGGGGDITPTPSNATTPTTMAARKQMIPLELIEPAKPLSAYALFFRDTVSAIKQQNPSCSFQELSKIVASMWDALDPIHKNVYNKKNELARNEYIKQMKVYRQQLEQQQQQPQQQTQEQIQNSNNTMMSNNDTKTTPINSNPQQQTTPQLVTNANNQQQQQPVVPNAVSSNVTSSAPSDEQLQLLTEANSLQKCTRENCNKRAIINPDWEDEYCSNECVIIHCRNVFNAWVQSNLEAKQQQQPNTT